MIGVALSVVSLGCAPAGEAGYCDESEPCPGRGQVCDTVEHLCTTEMLQVDSTEDPAPADFTDEIVPFFRGEVCLPTEVKSGSQMPVSISACLHPCIVPGPITFRHNFECIGSSCEAYATMWVEASSSAAGCPADAFARFDRGMCQYTTPAEFQIDTTDGPDGDIVGSMLIEIPYLTNADMKQIVDSGLDQDLTRELIQQYPQDSGRIPGQQAVWILPDNPTPPASCVDDSGCTCFDIGF